MAESIRFYFDPLCPWCYQTSRWARRLGELGVLDVEWRVFSLAIVNGDEKGRAAADTGSAPSLRTAIAVRAAHGNAAVGAFYKALSDARHQRGLALDDHAVIEASLREAGVEPELLEQALADPSTWEAVQREHDDAVSVHKAFGVPTIVLDGGDGPQMFGPIISEIPDDDAAVDLWQHFVWMARNPNVGELKRDRLPLDLESVRIWQREHERRELEKAGAAGRVTTTEVPTPAPKTARKHGEVGPRYKWVALSNTTIGMLMATVNSSIVLISLPAIFRGIKLNPLVPGNVSYLLWMIMGYMVVTAVLVVSLGRIGDMFGRVRLYNLGFLVFTVGSILLSLVFSTGPSAALELIFFRLIQGVGGAMIFACSTAILTDAFPQKERGMALGINAVAAVSGSFIGLIVGGLLSTTDWHLVFLVSVPVGLFGTAWAYLKLRETGIVKRSRVDWWGNVLFAVGLVSVLVGITYGIQPYGGHSMGWTNPSVLLGIIGGAALLVVFVVVETRVAEPMFRVSLFRIRGFTFGTVAALLSSVGRGGLMFMVIIWLQGIWLPQHGYSYELTPFWAAIFMLPLTAGFLIGGPSSGFLSDRLGSRGFATAGMIFSAIGFGLLMFLPANFSYLPFALLLFLVGVSMGMFVAPNTAGVMNSVPADRRGVASGMLATFQNSGMTLSIGIFFSLMIAGLSSTLPSTMFAGLTAHGVSSTVAHQVANLPPVGSLFAAFLGYNPMTTLLGPSLHTLSASQAAYLSGQTFFPNLISNPFIVGMHITFAFSVIMMLVGATASWLRGGSPAKPSAARAVALPEAVEAAR